MPAKTEVAAKTTANSGLKTDKMMLAPSITIAAEANGSTTRTTRSTIASTSAVTRTSRSPCRRPNKVVPLSLS